MSKLIQSLKAKMLQSTKLLQQLASERSRNAARSPDTEHDYLRLGQSLLTRAKVAQDGLIGVVECPCGAQMVQEMPRLGVGPDGRPGLSEQQIQMLERFRKKHRLATQIEAVSLWSRCLAVDAWNLRGGK